MQSRVRLWLRSERAFGLSSVPMQLGGIATDAHRESEVRDSEDVESPAEDVAVQTPARADAGVLSSGHGLFATEISSVPARPKQTPSPQVIATIPTAAKFDAATLPTKEKTARLIALQNNEVRGCTKCRLCESRTNTVFGEGDVDAKLVFIGEGPGENEDLQGRPFVGRAGEMLNKWIAAMGLRREQVYIANIVKCRPPGNREPAPDEVATCTPYLQRQLEIIRPQAIVTLGLPSLKYMMSDPKLTMGRSRGTWREWRGIKLMPTYHPAYILRNYTEQARAAVWSDLQLVMAELGLPVPKKSS